MTITLTKKRAVALIVLDAALTGAVVAGASAAFGPLVGAITLVGLVLADLHAYRVAKAKGINVEVV